MFTGDWINLTDYQVISDRYKGHAVARTKAMNKGLTQKIAVKAGKTYLFSVYVKSDKPTETAVVLNFNIDDTAENQITDISMMPITVYEEWTLVSYNITASKNGYVTPRLSKYDNNLGPDDVYLFISGMDFREQAEGGQGGDGTIRNYPINSRIYQR